MALRRSRVEDDIDQEIRSHLEMAADDHQRSGADPQLARDLALRHFGGVVRAKERYADAYRFRGAEALLQDVCYGLRALRQHPGVTLVAIAMLALGIGSNAAVFTLVNAALFEGFPLVHQSERIVQLTTTRNAIYYPDFEDWRAQATSFAGMTLVRGVFHTFSDNSGAVETCFTSEVTANTFQLLGVRPILGRDFLPSDVHPGAEPVVILRHDVWNRRFAADPAIVGRTVRVDGRPALVIGVMPEGFSFPDDPDLWMPLIPSAAALKRDTFYAQYGYARLGDEVDLERARAEMVAIGARLANAHPDSNQGVAPVVRPFEEWFIGTNAGSLYKGIWAAVVFVFLVICANVGNLFLARAIGRSREISVRLALGAERWRLVRQFFVESLLLSILGGAAGWWLADAAVRLYAGMQVRGTGSRLLALTVDGHVMLYLVAVSAATTLAVGFATAFHLTRLDINGALQDVARTIGGGQREARISSVLLGCEVVLAVVLLASAGTITRSFLNVSTADLGVDPSRVLTMSLYAPPDRYPTAGERRGFYRDLSVRLRAVPGVTSLAFGTSAPTDYVPRYPYEIADAPIVEERLRQEVAQLVVSPGYFDTLGARIVRGRDFNEVDRPSDLPVAIVNQRFAELHWPGADPIGKRLRLWPRTNDATPWLTVVGVASNVVQNDRTRQAFDPLVYVPYEQHAPPNQFVFARTSEAAEGLATAVMRQIYALDPSLPIPALMPLAERLDRAYALERRITNLLIVFAGVALLVASVGLFASTARSVGARTREFGIRMAVGASGADILRLVFNRAIMAVAVGLSAGLPAAIAMNYALESQLVGVSPADPVALAVASGALALSALAGCWIPAHRASRVDPVAALKCE